MSDSMRDIKYRLWKETSLSHEQVNTVFTWLKTNGYEVREK